MKYPTTTTLFCPGLAAEAEEDAPIGIGTLVADEFNHPAEVPSTTMLAAYMEPASCPPLFITLTAEEFGLVIVIETTCVF